MARHSPRSLVMMSGWAGVHAVLNRLADHVDPPRGTSRAKSRALAGRGADTAASAISSAWPARALRQPSGPDANRYGGLARTAQAEGPSGSG